MDSLDVTAAHKEMMNKRENDFHIMKRTLEEEQVAHEMQIQDLRQKHSSVAQELNEQLDQLKRVSHLNNCCQVFSFFNVV